MSLGKIDASRGEDDDVLTVAEVATELHCSKPHIYRAIRGEIDGVSKLPAICMGRKKLIRCSSLERWKRENESGQRDDTIPPSSELKPLTH